jgi:NADH-quinone oxidoreductase subunit J
MSGNAELVTFFVFAVPMLLAAAGVVMARNPVYAAMNLVATFFFMAGIYVLLVAHLIAFMQILVYAGAVMVLFLFVIMLLSVHEDFGESKPRAMQWLGAAGALGIFALLVAAVWNVAGGDLRHLPADFGTVKAVGTVLYTQYLLPFEATSLLLLVAIVGAVVIAKERI